MNIVVLRETQAGEARVALMPESVKKLIALKASVQIESGAGLGAARTDDDYREAGAEVSADRVRCWQPRTFLSWSTGRPPRISDTCKMAQSSSVSCGRLMNQQLSCPL